MRKVKQNEEVRKKMRYLVSPIIINPYDDWDILVSHHGYDCYIELEELLTIKEKLEKSIRFAMTHNIVEENNKRLEERANEIRNRNEEPKRKSRKTKIYLMIDRNTGYYKIGRSKSPSKREATLQSEKPTIELIGFWESTTHQEKQLHRQYDDKRIRGEWFSLSQSDVTSILSHENVTLL